LNESRAHVNARRVEWTIPDGTDFKVYRVCKMQYADLLGIGAAKVGGRWNSIGQRAVYTSLEIGTATLESIEPHEFHPALDRT
jgi:RES domain-containing protein